MKTTRTLVSAPRLSPLICAASIALFSTAAQAVTITKADNFNDLNLTTSWLLGTVPTASDIALWDATVTSASTVSLGVNLSWAGLRITSPTGPVTFNAGATLTLGTSGIDMSVATQSLTLNNAVTLLGNTTQTWIAGAGQTLQVNGTFTRTDGVLGGTRSTINFDTNSGGTINIATGTASTLLNYASLNKTDFAALDASKNIVAGATVVTYTPNPATGAANPNLVGTFAVLDMVNSNTTAGQTGVRIGSSTNISITSGIRFNTPHATGLAWTIDLAGRNLNVGNASILVTPNVGAGNVEINGSGNVRMGAGSELTLLQHNPAGDLVINGAITQPAGNGSSLTKAGAGRVILAGANAIGGVTRILEGTVQVGNGGTVGVLPGGAVIDHASLVFRRSDTIIIGNAISGTGSVTQAGTGTLSLTGVNTYTGPTNFNAGTTTFTALTNFGGGSALGFGGGALQWATGNTADISARAVTLSASSTLNTNGNNVTLANPIGGGGAGGFTKTGAGTLTLGSANSYFGATLISNGTLLVNNASGSGTGSGAVTVGNGATLGGTGKITGAVTVNTGGILAPGASVESLEVGGLTLSTGSALTFEFASLASYDVVKVLDLDGLILNGGALSLFAENTATPWSTPGTYNLFNYTGNLGGTGVAALSVANQQGGFNYTFGSTGTAITLTINTAGVISQWNYDGSDSWNAAGRWTAGVPNGAGQTARLTTALSALATVTLDGGKTVGALVFDSASHGYSITPGSGGTLTLNNGANPASVQVISGSHTVSAPVNLPSHTTVDVATSGTLTVSSAVDGTGSLTKVGNGTLILTGTSNYAGGTRMQGGTLEFNALAALGTGDLSFNGGKLRWAAGNTEDISTRIVTVDINGATLDTNGNDVTLLGSIGNNGPGGLTKTGPGTLTLFSPNTYTSATSINGGVLSISSNDQLGDATTGAGLTINGGKLASTSSFNLDNFGTSLRPVTIGILGGTIDTADLTTLTIAGSLGGSTLTKIGTGTLALNANNLGYTGGAMIDGGTIRLGGGDTNGQNGIGTGAIIFNNGTLEMNGHGLSTTPGYGTLANALIVPSGQTGTLKMSARGAVTSTLTGAGIFNLVVDYVRADWNGNASAFSGQINVSTRTGVQDFRVTNGFGFTNAKLHLAPGVYTYQNFNPPNTGTFETVQNIGELSGDVGSFLAGNPVAGRYVNWTVGGLGTDSTFAGNIQDTPATGTGNLITPGQARFTKVGNGTLTLTGLNTFTGAARVTQGTIIAASDSPLGGTTGAGLTLNPATTATVKFTSAAPAIASLANTGAGISRIVLGDPVAGTPTVLSIGGSGASTIYTGEITDGRGINPLAVGTITKVGTGFLTLSGSQTYQTLTGYEGTAILASTLGTGNSIVNVAPAPGGTATVQFEVSQALAELNLGDGGIAILGAPAPAPAPPVAEMDFGAIAPVSAQAVPEPGCATLFIGGMLTLLARRRRGA